MKEFIVSNWQSIVVIALILIVGIILFLKRRDKFFELLQAAVTKAELFFSSGEGAKKKAYAVRMVYEQLPPWVKLCISEDKFKAWIDKWIEKTVDWLHNYLDGLYTKALSEYKAEE